MNYTTFDNKKVNFTEIDHQHLSNIYWFNKILNGIDLMQTDAVFKSFLQKRIQNEFNGEIIPYQPKSSFTSEINELDRRGLLSWREEDGVRVADICYDGHVVGKACYLSDQRELTINKLIDI